MPRAQPLHYPLTCLLVAVLCNIALGQGTAEPNVEVPDQLRTLDQALQKQLGEWWDARDALLERHGKATPEYWEVEHRLNPLSVHGHALLKHAQDHAGSPEGLVCLTFLVDFGEGSPRDLYVAACDELIAQYPNHPALSWLCSRCTNPLFFEQMEEFLTRLRNASSNPYVQAAATFHLAELLDTAVAHHGRLAEIRDIREASGVNEARPDIRRGMETLANLNPDVLAHRRDQLLEEVQDRFADTRPWIARHTFGQLDYVFSEEPDGQTFQQLADGLAYEVANLRVGCTAPDFEGSLTDGRSFRLSDRGGKPTLLMFSFKGCSPCEAMYPALRAVQQRFSQAGFSVIGVLVDDELDTAVATANSDDVTWPCVWEGSSGPIAKAYRVRGYPTTFLLNGEGRITNRFLPREIERLMAHVEKVVSGE